MKTWTAFALSFSLVVFSLAEESAPPSLPAHRMGTLVVETAPGAIVTVEQQAHAFPFGTALSASMFSGRHTSEDREKYQAVLTENFNAVVPSNAMKWYSTERRRGVVDYGPLDRMLDWCAREGLPMRGHCVFWAVDQFVQDWVKALDDEALRAAMEGRATDLLGRYRGRVNEHDINNEMVHGDFYIRRLGDGIRKQMFDWCLEANPDAVLYVNDFGILSGGDLAKYEAQIEGLLSQGARLGGIGLQGHFHKKIDAEHIRHVLDALARFELPIKITEFDVLSLDEEHKAQGLETLYRTAFEHPAVEGILMWGFWAGAHWRATKRWGVEGYTALWDRDWNPTPSAETYRRLVFDEWWTRFEGKADADGRCEVPVFLGRHRVAANGRDATVRIQDAGAVQTVQLRTEP